MSDAPHPPTEELFIDDLETLKVIADPLRMDIMAAVLHQPRTVKEIAAAVEREPSKLYYHVNLLEKHGLIIVVETRVVSGIIEKQYRAAAHSIEIDKRLLTPDTAGDENLELMLSTIFDATKADLRRSFRAGVVQLEKDTPDRALLFHARLRLTAAQYAELQQQLEAILQTYNDKSDADPAAAPRQRYGLTIALYRSISADGREVT
ncbi:MAG: helix-turn-helix transcriptional regulator [Anaerolineales bacterium]|nr:helix-turn-helix transcriptional regulator [Anaerolineales bacterium]